MNRSPRWPGCPVERGDAGPRFRCQCLCERRLRAPEGKIVSRYDATFAVDDPYPERRSSRSPDPILDVVTRAYGGAMASYLPAMSWSFKTEMSLHTCSRATSNGTGGAVVAVQASAEDDLRALLAYDPIVPSSYQPTAIPDADHAIRRNALRPRSFAGVRSTRPRAAQTLPRRAHDLSRSAIAQGVHCRRQRAFYRGGENKQTSGSAAAVEFERVETDVPVDDVNQPALIQHNIIALRCRTPAGGLRDEIADFARAPMGSATSTTRRPALNHTANTSVPAMRSWN